MTYVILGSSAAGVNAVRELRRLKPEAHIILISKDEFVYSRCILHHYLGGTRSKDELIFVEPDFEKRYKVEFHKNTTCTRIDSENKRIYLSNDDSHDSCIHYDKLLIATGAHTFAPPIEGLKGTNQVIGFRNFDDILQIQEKLAAVKHVAVMGAGLVGLDAVTGLLHLGIKPVLIETAPHILCKQLDAKSASVYEAAFEDKGVELHLNTGISKVISGDDNSVKELLLSDGTKVPCDLLILAAGVRPNIDFLEDSGILTDKFGLVIDESGQTNLPDVYGAGDVTGRSPIWPAAVKEGLIAASNMAGVKQGMTDFFASKATMNFLDIPSLSLGGCEKPDESYTEEIEENGQIYRKVIHKDGKIYGAILQGDLSYAGVLTQLIARQIDVSKVKKPLFQIDYSDFFHIKDNFEFYYEETDNA